MRVIVYTQNLPVSDPESLIDVDLPRPSPRGRDLLIEVVAVSVNPVDVKQRAASPAPLGGRILGYDGAGIVRETGSDVGMFEVGDEVYWAGQINRPGSDAQFQLVDERIVGHKPRTIDFADAAALPLTTITAWELLFDRLGLTADSTGHLLVVGATGGVGSMVVQLTRALAPEVTIVATASTPEGANWVLELGADQVVDHRRGLLEQVGSVAPGGIDWIFSSHTEGQIDTYASILRPFGQIAAIDDPQTLDIVPLKSKSIAFHWEFMFTRPVRKTPDMVAQHELLDQVATLVDAGRIVSTATTRLAPLDAERLREAHGLVETGHTIGKVVLSGWPA